MTRPPPPLLPYQAAWQEDPAPIRVAEKSRRIGFTWNAACERSLKASEIGGCDTWYIGYNKEMSEEFIRDCAFWARKFQLVCSSIEEGEIFEGGDEDKGILTFTIRFASGWRITALSSRPTNLRGKDDHVIIDEAAFHEDLPGLLKAAMAVRVWGGRVDIISTHNGVENPFNKLVNDIREGRMGDTYSLHRVTLKDAIAEGFYRRICLVKNREWTAEGETQWEAELRAEQGDNAAEEFDVIPARSGGTYISRAVVERQMRDGPVYRLTLPKTFVTRPEEERIAHVKEWCELMQPSIDALPKTQFHFFGEDFGRTSDRSVITPGYLTKDLRKRFPFAVEMLGVPYSQQEQVLFWVVDRLPRFFHGALDATGNGGALAEAALQRYGQERISCIILNNPWYAQYLPRFKAAFDDEMIEIVRDADHASDLSALKVIDGIPKLPKAKNKSAIAGAPPRHGDAAIGYVLGDYAARMPMQEYGYDVPPPDKRNPRSGVGRSNRRGVM